MGHLFEKSAAAVAVAATIVVGAGAAPASAAPTATAVTTATVGDLPRAERILRPQLVNPVLMIGAVRALSQARQDSLRRAVRSGYSAYVSWYGAQPFGTKAILAAGTVFPNVECYLTLRVYYGF